MTTDEVKARFPPIKFLVDDEYLQSVLDFAVRRGRLNNLMEKFEWFAQGAFKPQLGKDFAPYSFSFVLCRQDGSYWINGAVIYYGPGDSGVGAPVFSVRNGSTEEGWEINS